MNEKILFNAWLMSTIWLYATGHWIAGSISLFIIGVALIRATQS